MNMENEKTSMPATGASDLEDGFGNAYRYRNPKNRMYEITTDRLEAERMAGSDYETVRVHLTGGCIDRVIEGCSPCGQAPVVAGCELGPSDYDELLELESPDAPAVGNPGSAPKNLGNHGAYPRICHLNQPENGIGLAYRYIDPETGDYGWSSDATRASVLAGGGIDAFWVLYRNGEIDHAIDESEWREELEVRVGERISEGLSHAKLNEFDLITDQEEATRWLRENRPDYHEIVALVREEMERGLVMEDGEARRPKA